MDRPAREWSRAQIAAAWLAVVVIFGGVVAVWVSTIGSEFATHLTASVPTPEPNFGARQTVVQSSGDPTSLATQAPCLFTQNDQGTVIVMSAATGSLLTPAQAANCGK